MIEINNNGLKLMTLGHTYYPDKILHVGYIHGFGNSLSFTVTVALRDKVQELDVIVVGNTPENMERLTKEREEIIKYQDKFCDTIIGCHTGEALRAKK